MLDVVLDYGKRFPNVKIKDLGLDFTEELMEDKISMLFVLQDCLEHLGKMCSTFRYSNNILYFSNKDYKWQPVSNHIILRFATEGKEDLI